MSRFQRATRHKAKLRMAIDGPAKAGKSFTSLRFAFALGKRIAAIDTESGSLSKYQGDAPDGVPFDFEVTELTSFSPTEYTAAIEDAGREGFDVLVIDSLSHAWAGKDGALEIKDRAGGNSFAAWKDVTPMHNRMVEAILTSPCHVIATMRSKMDYILEPDEKGRMVPRKVGLAPVQRQGMEYEFDMCCTLDTAHVMRVSGSRCRAVDNAVVSMPGPDFMRPVIEWLNRGDKAPAVVLPRRVGDEQLARLRSLAARLKLTPAKIKAGLLEFHKADFPDLMEAEADAVETRLLKKLPAAQLNGPSVPPPSDDHSPQTDAASADADAAASSASFNEKGPTQ